MAKKKNNNGFIAKNKDHLKQRFHNEYAVETRTRKANYSRLSRDIYNLARTSEVCDYVLCFFEY